MYLKRKTSYLVLAMMLIVGLFPTYAFGATDVTTTASESVFSDMPNNWSTEALNNAVANGLLGGSGGKIRPDDDLTRAEMAAIIVRAFSAKSNSDLSKFTDVNASAWYASELSKAHRMGIIQGSGNKLNPEQAITRQEAFIILARALKLQAAETLNVAFSDSADIASWAKGEVAALVNAGYVKGSGGKLSPKSNISRAEFAQIMDNLIKQYVKTAGTVTEVASGNVMVNASGVTVDGVSVAGDLIIGDGVGNGEVTLNNVTIDGRLVVRGGGENSIIIKGDSSVGTVIVSRVDGVVSIKVQDGAKVEVIYVADGSDDVHVSGQVGSIELEASDVTVTAIGANVSSIAVSGSNSGVIVDKDSKVGSIVTSAPGTTVSGEGDVIRVEVREGGNNASIQTPNTLIVASSDVTGVTGAGGDAVAPGTSGTNNGSGSAIVTTPPNVVIPVYYSYVSNESELRNALTNSTLDIYLTADIEEVDSTIEINRPVTIYGNGKTISFTSDLNGLPDGQRQGLLVLANNVTLNGIKVVMDANPSLPGPSSWNGVYGVQVYNVENVTIANFTGSGGDAALLVNGSVVTLSGTIDVSGNEFGGIEVARGTDAVRNGSLNISSVNTWVNATEAVFNPTIWVVDGEGELNGGNLTENTSYVDDQIQYYLDPHKAVAVLVSSEDQLRTAVAANGTGKFVVLTDHINATATINVYRPVIIDGKYKQISFPSSINVNSNMERHGIVIYADDVTLSNVVVTMDADNNGWQGVYAVQVYLASNVTISNFAGSNADAAILVNGAQVRLAGMVVMGFNEFGGIEVSRGSMVETIGRLDISSAQLINFSQGTDDDPTIWVIDGEGEITGVNSNDIEIESIAADGSNPAKTYYFLITPIPPEYEVS